MADMVVDGGLMEEALNTITQIAIASYLAAIVLALLSVMSGLAERRLS